MSRLFFASILIALSVPAVMAEVTFYKDVVPLLQKRCQTCHRPGEIGPMPLVTYSQVRPWAKAIREAVRLRKMPPWFAGRSHGEFENDASLTAQEIETIDTWVTRGAAEGSKKDAPPDVSWTRGWNIPPPDIVISMPQPFIVPPKVEIDYQYLILPTGFSIARWVQAIEIRPGDPSVVHHAVLYVREPGSEWLRDAPRGITFAPPRGDADARRRAGRTTSDVLAIYTPGSGATVLPRDMAKRIPTGADLVLQMHYTPKQTASEDRTEIGIVLATATPRQQVLTLQMGRDDIVIPPGERDYRLSVSGTLPRDALLLSLFPHMHLRGSAFEYQIAGPNGYMETLLLVKPYDFYWQLSYRLKTPRLLRRGTKLMFTGYFDNSPDNPRNPDPSAEVTWGEQSSQEMMIGFFDVAVDPNLDKRSFFVRE